MRQLALAFGIWDIEVWLEEMTLPQLWNWLDFLAREPIGERRADMRVAVAAHALACVANPEAARRLKVEDFMLRLEAPRPRAPKTAEQIRSVISMFGAMAPGRTTGARDG